MTLRFSGKAVTVLMTLAILNGKIGAVCAADKQDVGSLNQSALITRTLTTFPGEESKNFEDVFSLEEGKVTPTNQGAGSHKNDVVSRLSQKPVPPAKEEPEIQGYEQLQSGHASEGEDDPKSDRKEKFEEIPILGSNSTKKTLVASDCVPDVGGPYKPEGLPGGKKTKRSKCVIS